MLDLINETEEIYKETMSEQGSKKTNLLGVLQKGMGHNHPSAHHLGIITISGQFGMPVHDEVIKTVTYRTALIQRHMSQAQGALKEIYELAKKNGHKDIVDIFERDYFVGHAK
jgi:hypothetical protein